MSLQVWLHGGGFQHGTTSAPEYNGRNTTLLLLLCHIRVYSLIHLPCSMPDGGSLFASLLYSQGRYWQRGTRSDCTHTLQSLQQNLQLVIIAVFINADVGGMIPPYISKARSGCGVHKLPLRSFGFYGFSG